MFILNHVVQIEELHTEKVQLKSSLPIFRNDLKNLKTILFVLLRKDEAMRLFFNSVTSTFTCSIPMQCYMIYTACCIYSACVCNMLLSTIIGQITSSPTCRFFTRLNLFKCAWASVLGYKVITKW